MSAPQYQAFVRDTNRFGFDLFRKLASSNENVFYSPASLTTVLGMAYAGASGATARQMADCLRSTIPPDAFHAAVNRLTIELSARPVAPTRTDDGEKSVELALVQAAWSQKGLPFARPYLDLLGVEYDTGIMAVDFAGKPSEAVNTINAWIAQRTSGRVKTLIGPDAVTSDTRLLLTGTIDLRASWANAFDVRRTIPGTFSTLSGSKKPIPMMNAMQAVRYVVGDGFQLIELPYYGEQLSSVIVLPAEGRFQEVRDRLTIEAVEQARGTMRVSQVAIGMPRFQLRWGTRSLRQALQALGMTDAFTSLADFSGIEPNRALSIGDVLQQTVLAVTEAGTEASAATAAEMAVASAEAPDTVRFTVDRPFLMFIRDASGVLLFDGQILDVGGG